MKRDMRLVRKLLEYIEEHGSARYKGAIPIEGYDRDAVVYHLLLMADGGFVQLGSETLTNMGTLLLSWKGCDYLEHLRGKDAPK